MKKFLMIFGISFVVLIVVVSVVAGIYIGPIVKISIEQIGPKISKVSTKVDTVDIGLLTGSAKIKGLVVGNPEGYSAPQAISVGTIAVSLDPSSIMSQKIVVHSVQIESPEITFETGLGGNNLSKILANVNSTAQKGPMDSSNTQANNKPAPKIEIDDFLITNAKVHVGFRGVGSQVLSLPTIHLTGLGKNSDGLTPAQLTSAILKVISVDTIQVVTTSVGFLSHGVQNIGKSAGNALSDNVNKITSGLGGLLGK